MRVTTNCLKTEVEQLRWQQTLEAMESAAHGKVVDATEVHDWLGRWGSNVEQAAPQLGLGA
jgi:predicted transcriptional regulator